MTAPIENYMVRNLEEILSDIRQPETFECCECGNEEDVRNRIVVDPMNCVCSEDCENKVLDRQARRQAEINNMRDLTLIAGSEHNQRLFNGTDD